MAACVGRAPKRSAFGEEREVQEANERFFVQNQYFALRTLLGTTKFCLEKSCPTPDLKQIFGRLSCDVQLRAYAHDQEWDDKSNAPDKKTYDPKI